MTYTPGERPNSWLTERGPDKHRASRSDEPLLSLRNVSKSYGAVRALVDVNLDVFPFEVVAIVGDNGAGKSTLVEVMAGAIAAERGDVIVDGHPVTFSSPAAARGHGIARVLGTRGARRCPICWVPRGGEPGLGRNRGEPDRDRGRGARCAVAAHPRPRTHAPLTPRGPSNPLEAS